MAFDAANQVSKAQRVYIEGIYETYQKKADFLRFIESKVEEVPTNYLGRQVVLETKPNPSLSFGNLDGGDLATPGNPTLDNLLVTYQWMNSGFEQTYGAILNNNRETVDDPFKRAVKSSAAQFAQWLNYYVSAGNGTTALATASANYSGGTPTIFTANGATDSFGATRVVDGQKGYIYDATGTTQRTGTVGAGVLTISSHTKTAITFTTNAPSDFISGDIFVPEGGNTVGIKGIPYLVNNTGNYFNKSRTAVPGLQSQVIAVNGALTAAALLQGYATVAFAAGLDDDGNTDALTIASGMSQWYNYMGLITPVSFQHNSGGRPDADIGTRTLTTTWFGVRMRRFFWLRSDHLYMLMLDSFKMAVLKKVGQIQGMPAGDPDGLQKINGTTSSYAAATQRWLDFAGDVYCTSPFQQLALTGLTMSVAMQKS
jgi:hypothetical protein